MKKIETFEEIHAGDYFYIEDKSSNEKVYVRVEEHKRKTGCYSFLIIRYRGLDISGDFTWLGEIFIDKYSLDDFDIYKLTDEEINAKELIKQNKILEDKEKNKE